MDRRFRSNTIRIVLENKKNNQGYDDDFKQLYPEDVDDALKIEEDPYEDIQSLRKTLNKDVK